MSTDQWSDFRPEQTTRLPDPETAPPPPPAEKQDWSEFTPPLEHDFNPFQMLLNAPGSATDALVSTATPFFEPEQTMELLWDLVKGGSSKAYRKAREFFQDTEIEPAESEAHVDAVIKYFTDRYGGIENIQRTLEEDPAGMLLDWAAFSRGGGAVTGMPSTRGLIEKGVQRMDPVAGYERVAKFSTTATPEQRKKWATTALEENLSPKPEHVELLQTRVTGLKNQVDDLIAKAEASGTEVPVDAVFKLLKELRAELGGAKFEGGADLQAIDKAIAGFRQHMQSLGKDTMTPKELQAFKIDLYDRINWDRRNQTGTLVGEETKKNVARATKEIIEGEAKGTGPLNERMADLLDLKEPLSRSSARIANRRKFGLMQGLGIGSSSALGMALTPILGPQLSTIIMAIGSGASLMATPKNMALLNRAKYQVQQIMKQHEGIGTSQRILGDLAHVSRLLEETQQELMNEEQE